MKKIVAMLLGAILMGACVFALGDNSAKAYVERPVGVYQCAICGVISRIVNPGTVLNERDYLGDGHTHDWRYIGPLGGTIHPIK